MSDEYHKRLTAEWKQVTNSSYPFEIIRFKRATTLQLYISSSKQTYIVHVITYNKHTDTKYDFNIYTHSRPQAEAMLTQLRLLKAKWDAE